MLRRKEALLNPYMRKYIVCFTYRRLIKEKNKVFDPAVMMFMERKIDELKM
jgi:hypothetical protein